MSSSPRRFRNPPNPVTQAAFRRQVRLEVYLPVALAVLGLALLVALVVVVGYGTRSAWADVALMLLAAPVALLLLLLTGVLGGAVFLMIRLIQEVPSYTSTLQQGADRVAGAVARGSEAAVKPVLLPEGIAAALAQAGRSMRAAFRRE